MNKIRAWKYRLYPSKGQKKLLDESLLECKNLWNSLLEYTKQYYDETGIFPTKSQLCNLTKDAPVFSQVAQNVADRLIKSIKLMFAKRKSGKKAGFPRFKSLERIKSFTYPQFGFKLYKNKIELSAIGSISMKKHREMTGKVKTLIIKRSPSSKWHAVFTTEGSFDAKPKNGNKIGIDLGIENFACLSNGKTIANPRHIKKAEENLKKAHRVLSKKKKGSNNRKKARLKLAISYEKLRNRRSDFLHKTSRILVADYSFIALEDLNVNSMARGFLAKSILDCSWTEFIYILTYKAEEAGCEIVLVDPAHTTQKCSNCGSINKKALSERWHDCSCGEFMHRDLNAARNILSKAASGTGVSNACGKGITTHHKSDGQTPSMKQEAHDFSLE